MSKRATFIVDLLDEHLEELGFLWGQWRAALRSPEYTLRSVGDLEERIQGHLQGVLVPGEQARPCLLEALEGTDSDLVFSSAYSMLHSGSPDLTDKLLDGFQIREDDTLGALTIALSYGPLPSAALDRLRAMLSARPATRAVAAAEVLALHRALQITGDQLRYFLEDDDATVRMAGWRLAALLGTKVPSNAYSAAVRDAELGVGLVALEAGAWSGAQGVIAVLRHLDDPARPDRMDILHLLAVLATAEDTTRILAALNDASLGPDRFVLASTFGAPALVPTVINALADPDPATAAAAGAAFGRMTGVGVDSDVRAKTGQASDSFEAEFQDEVSLPDAALARREWEKMRARLESAKRLSRGVDIEAIQGSSDLLDLDMKTRRDFYMRAACFGKWQGTLLELELFPQRPRPAAGSRKA